MKRISGLFLVIAMFCFSVVTFVKSNIYQDVVLDITMGCIESLADNESIDGIPIKKCVKSDEFSEKDTSGHWFIMCDDRTTDGMMYSCKELKEGYMFGYFRNCIRN